MGEKDLIQVSVQLPAGSLDSLTQVVRQLRQLVAEVKGGGPTPAAGAAAERGESGGFDEARYEALLTGRGPEAERVRAEIAGAADAPGAFRTVRERIREPDRAGEEDSLPPRDGDGDGSAPPPSGEPDRGEEADRPAPGTDREAVPDPQAVRGTETERPEDIPVLRVPPPSQVEDAPQAGMEPESLIPEAEAVWAERAGGGAAAPPDGPVPLPSSPATPQTAAVQMSEGPEAVRSRWSGVTEELVSAGPAPLTAEAVSLAFRRDGRRYDNGFPLY